MSTAGVTTARPACSIGPGITKLNDGETPRTVHVTATKEDGSKVEFDAVVRIGTPGEADYYRNGGTLQYVLRKMTA